MYDPAAGRSRAPEISDPLARADALEREITDLCAHLNAAGYRLLQLIAELDDEAPWGARGLVIHARLPAEEGAVVLQALGAAMAPPPAEPAATPPEDVTAVTPEPSNRFAQRRADALVTMAETSLRQGAGTLSPAERYQVVVHVSAETLAAGEAGRCELDHGPGLAPDTARRIACDSSLLRITEDVAGNPLDIGRRTRAVPPAMRRALVTRDGGCRFPGCNHDRFVDAHHIRHWADGGDTAIGNLVLLCRHHHRLVHEGGFGVERIGDNRIRFRRPDGRVIEAHPRLPASGSVAGLRRANRATGAVIDASSWIIAGDTMNYGIAIEGLMTKRERATCDCQTAR